jgi:tetratricopeptide (TPR) repeat protein
LAIQTASSDTLAADAFFWRGRVRIERGRPVQATKDFEEATKLRPEGAYFAYWGYVCAREDELSTDEAVFHGDQAIQRDFATPEVYNNLGFALYSIKEFGRAVVALDQAVQLDPELTCARYNRALVFLQQALRSGGKVDPQACVDIDHVVREGTPSAYLYYNAAQILWLSGDHSTGARARILEYLRMAVELGFPLATIQSDFSPIGDQISSLNILPAKTELPPCTMDDRLVDPLRRTVFSFR